VRSLGRPAVGVRGISLEKSDAVVALAVVVRDATLLVTVREGRNRQVRRMFEAVGHPVRRLVRVRIGPLADRSLAPGEWRALTSAEVRSLYSATQDAGVTATPEPPKDPGGDGGPG
jgi:23S rRNA pseudouridine2605 synthase